MSLAKFLKKYREKVGKNQAEIAQILGVPRTTYRQWELELREPPPYTQDFIKKTLQAAK